MTKYITEILAEINKEPSKITRYKENYAIKMLLQYTYNPELRFILPDGRPPFNPDPAPLGMSPANFYQQVKKLYIFTRKDLGPLRMQSLFIQMLESVHPSEAEVILAIKEGDMTTLYPNITRELVEGAGIVPPTTFSGKSDTPDLPDGGQKLVVNISESVKTAESFGNKGTTKTEEVVLTPEELGEMTKKEIDEYAKTVGINLDRRKKKETMIQDFLNYIQDDNK